MKQVLLKAAIFLASSFLLKRALSNMDPQERLMIQGVFLRILNQRSYEYFLEDH